MKRAIILSAKDRRHLLLACVMGGGGAAIAARLLIALVRLAGSHRVEAEGPLLALSVVIGVGAGLMLFLQRELLRPLNQLLKALPRHALDPLPLRLNSGIAPLQLLLRRLNALLAEQRHKAALQQEQCNDLAHDIRAPLTRLFLRVAALRQQEAQDRKLLNGLEADLEALRDLDADLGELGQTSTHPLRRERVLLGACVRQLACSYAPADVLVEIEPSRNLLVDRRWLQRTLHNLIDNALEYGGPPVMVRCTSSSDGLVIVVEDAGPTGRAGLHPTTALKSSHQGRGWAIARGFCRNHGGTMQIGHSPQGGMQVRLSLPQSRLRDGGV
ncbi:sensor histidine kinase [Vulcanococcus sp.]|uniref:sensor histidine kinase n=1 Tax=Vulcanococcus sp. TaxID=2856995 RepID=UPI003F69B1F0